MGLLRGGAGEDEAGDEHGEDEHQHFYPEHGKKKESEADARRK